MNISCIHRRKTTRKHFKPESVELHYFTSAEAQRPTESESPGATPTFTRLYYVCFSSTHQVC